MKEFFDEIGVQAIFVVILYIATLSLVLCDLWSGIRKAKQRGEYRSSFGLRKTITKLVSYYNLLMVLTIIDTLMTIVSVHLALSIKVFPFVTLVGVLIISIIEVKSIFEKADKKAQAKAQDAMKTLLEIAKNKDDIEKLLEVVKSKKNENE